MLQPTLTKKELRHFGFILASAFILLFGVLIPLLKHQSSPIWPWALSGVLCIFSFFLPKVLRFIYTPWMKLGNILGWINTRIILGFLFFIVITPMSIVLKLLKYDPLNRKLDPHATTYRIQNKNESIKHMERPY